MDACVDQEDISDSDTEDPGLRSMQGPWGSQQRPPEEVSH